MTPRTMALVAAGATAAAIAAFFVPEWEGYSATSYQDGAKIWTICAGHTAGVRSGQYATPEECAQWLQSDLGAAFAALDRHVKTPLPAPTRAALASFIFNVGEGAFRKSTLLGKLNANDIEGACNELSRWVYVAGVRSRGLTDRRKAERELCLMGANDGQR